jgi:putative aldouronate transport system substrate-binding protein
MWDANRFNGKIYGIPLGVTQGWFDGFWIRQDLREKYGLAKPKTLKDIEAFFYAVKKNEPQVHPFPFSTVQDFEFFGSIYQVQPQPAISPWGGSPVLVGDLTSHPKALPVWGSPDWLPTAKMLRKWNTDGIIESNVMTLKHADQLPLFQQGQYASLRMDSTGQNTKTVKPLFKNVPTAKLEAVYPYEMSDPKPWSDFKQWNFLCVSKTSKNPTKVIALMDWLSIRENHDLISYGIKGKHWTPVGDTAMTLPEGQTYNFPTYELSMRPALERLLADTDPLDKQWYEYAANANNFTPSPLIGFTWNEQPVKTELAGINAVASEYAPGFAGGVYDVDPTLAKMQDAYRSAGYDKVIAEFQSQVDKFLAEKTNK